MEINTSYSKNQVLAIAILCLLPIGTYALFQTASNHKTQIDENPQAQFIVSSWARDNYGQGFDGIDAQENSTGDWLYVEPFGGIPEDFNVTLGTFIRFRVDVILNSTLTGATSLADGKNYVRLNISVSNNLAVVVFSQTNFTYYGGAVVGDLNYYIYHVILNFTYVSGAIYHVTISYEVYYIP